MKLIAIGDIHGLSTWKDIINKEKDFDKVVFIGDYLDSFDIKPADQLSNLLDIIQFKKDNSDKVETLIGNHDYQYWPDIQEEYSGYQPHMKPSFEYIFRENKDLFKMVYKDVYNTYYSHAGISETFLAQNNIVTKNYDGELNAIFKRRPERFAFNNRDMQGFGDCVYQSCIWIRPQSLYNDQINELQVVGHTSVNQINHPAKSERRGFYLIDCLHNRQYLVCIDGKFEVRQLEKTN